MDDTERRHVAMHRDKKRKPLFLPGGKVPSDGERWKPDMKAVQVTIKYALATGRLDTAEE
jgi:hypothetical protein